VLFDCRKFYIRVAYISIMDKVNHFEIPVDDKKKAQEFYGKVFGWKFREEAEMDYTMVRTTEVDENHMPKDVGAINGGMYKRDENSAKNPVIVITVASLDETAEKIKESGGEIVREKVKVGEMGYYAQFKDCEGNVLGIWELIRKEGASEEDADSEGKDLEEEKMEVEAAVPAV
jgi:uncharacterized protein